MGKFRDAFQRQAAKAEADLNRRPGRRPADRRPEAEKAWDRGDAVYVHRTSQSIANYKFEQRIINAEVNAITALGWQLSDTTTKLGAIIFTFVRPVSHPPDT